jgi:hypothetical protein
LSGDELFADSGPEIHSLLGPETDYIYIATASLQQAWAWNIIGMPQGIICRLDYELLRAMSSLCRR